MSLERARAICRLGDGAIEWREPLLDSRDSRIVGQELKMFENEQQILKNFDEVLQMLHTYSIYFAFYAILSNKIFFLKILDFTVRIFKTASKL